MVAIDVLHGKHGFKTKFKTKEEARFESKLGRARLLFPEKTRTMADR